MSTLQERPRLAAAALAALALVVIAAMLIGGAITAGGDTPAPASASSRVAPDRTSHRVDALERELTLERGHVREQTSRGDAIDQRAQRWRTRALRAERQLKTARRARARRR